MSTIKKFTLLLIAIFSFSVLYAQDSLFIYKENSVISKYAVDAVDSITFMRNTTNAEPKFTSFGFEKDNNSFLVEDKDADIDDTDIKVKLPLTGRLWVASFKTNKDNTVTVNGVNQESGKTVNDFTDPVVYKITTLNGESEEYTVKVKWKTGLPHIMINTKDATPITSKEEYLRAYLIIDGMGMFDDFVDSTRIKGRGNSTWRNPKKPYKIKLDSKESLLGLKKEKDWVLLANYIDPTHLLNLTAFKVGQLLDMPFTNHGIAVNVTVNGEYMGIYTFTEQVEVKKNRVNVDKKKGVLLELDSYFDEPFKFKSTHYNLPIMIKDPDLSDEKPGDQVKLLNKIKADFTELEVALADADFPNTNYKDFIDIESLVKFFIVCDITDNQELNHPKSTYIHKDKKGKYVMGPIWDFDWAYSYESSNGHHFRKYTSSLFWGNKPGSQFFSRFMQDPAVKSLYKQEWNTFKTEHLPQIIKYIDAMVINIGEYQVKDYQKWNKGAADYPAKILEFKTWLQNRANHIDSKVSNW